MLRCKFEVESIMKVANGRTLKLHATRRNSADNEQWAQWTPCGTLEIHVTNPGAFPQIDAMEPGDLYFIDVTEAREREEISAGDVGRAEDVLGKSEIKNHES